MPRPMLATAWHLVCCFLVTSFAGCPPGGGGTPPALRDVGIRKVATTTTDLGSGCFLVNLSYDILPWREAQAYEVSYSFSREVYVVKGLDGHIVSRSASGEFKVSKSFQVCQRNRAGTRVFLFEILARSPVDFFRAFPQAISVRGSSTWDMSLEPTVEALRATLDKGPISPSLLRQYWRALAAFFHGGYQAYEAAVDRRIDQELKEFEHLPDPAVLSAYRSIMKENGGHVDVTLHTGLGLVSAVRLNEAYQMGADYQAGVLALLGSGPLRDLLGLDGKDALVLTEDEATEASRTVVLERFRDGVRVVPDRLTIVLSPIKGEARGAAPVDGWVVQYLASDIGRVGQASCVGATSAVEEGSGNGGVFGKGKGNGSGPGGASGSGKGLAAGGDVDPNMGAEASTDIEVDADLGSDPRPKSALGSDQATHDEPEESIERTVLHSLEDGYRCVNEVFSVRTGIGDSPAAHHLMTDAATGEVLKDDMLEVRGGNGEDAHHFEVKLAVPFSGVPPTGGIDHQNTRYVRLPYGNAWAFRENPDGTLDSDYTDETLFDGSFSPNSIEMVSEDGGHDAFRYMLRVGYDGDQEDFYFYPIGYHVDHWREIYRQWDNLSIDSPDLAFKVALNAPWNLSSATRDIAFTTHAYFLYQYMRYIWGHHDPANPVWSEPFFNRDKGDRQLKFETLFDAGECGLWNGYNRIKISINGCLNASDMWDVIPHEFGHWAANVWASTRTRNSSGKALNEGYSDYIASSMLANWRSVPFRGDSLYAVEDFTFDSKVADRAYRGNALYSSILHDHDRGHDGTTEGSWYKDSINWSGMFEQYMNQVGSLHSDRTITRAYRYHSDRVAPVGGTGGHWNDPCWAGQDMTMKCAHSMANRMYARDLVYRAGGHWVEIQKAAKRHDWHRKLNLGSAKRAEHYVSMSPSHAYALTPNSNHLSYTLDRFDRSFDVKWVSFFASAGVRYLLHSATSASTRVNLWSVSDSHNASFLASSRGCSQSTERAADTQGVKVFDNDPVHCQAIGNPFDGAVTFQVNRSGWYYASVHYNGGAQQHESGAILLWPDLEDWHITARGSESEVGFVLDREGSLGQSIPLSFRILKASHRAIFRTGTFRGAEEHHPWRFQYHVPRRFSEVGSEQKLSNAAWLIEDNSDFQYRVTIRRRQDNTQVTAMLSCVDAATGALVVIPDGSGSTPGVVYADGAHQGRRQETWSVPAWYLAQLCDSSGRSTNGGNVFIDLWWSGPPPLWPPTFVPRATMEYDILVFSEHGESIPGIKMARLEDDSTVINPNVIQRRCGGEPIERSFESYTVNESLTPGDMDMSTPGDADFFQIWLNEGEHLNVTYRGEIPAAIDMAGPMKADFQDANGTDHKVTHSELRYPIYPAVFIPKGRFIDDWRPVFPDAQQNMLPADYLYAYPKDQLFAERGYLWSLFEPDMFGHPDPTVDNAIHLTATAFSTGPYTIRVRSQRDPVSGVGAKGYWRWDSDSQEVGAPYTLNIHFGLAPNHPRPHWQYLQPGQRWKQIECTSAPQ